MILVARSKKSRRRSIRIITTVIILSIVFIGLIALTISFGMYVNSLGTIYPNVWAEGLNMSGLTADEARRVLIDDGYETQASNISITIYLPHDKSFTITGDDVGLTLDASEAARAAYNYGRGGTFIGNTAAYIKAMFSKTELTELSFPEYDDVVIRAYAEEYALAFNESLFNNGHEITDEQITVVKGTGYMPVTADELFSFTDLEMRRAIERHTHTEARFIPESSDDEMVNLQSIYEYIHSEPVSSRYSSERGNPNSPSYDPVFLGATESLPGKTFDLQAAEETLLNARNGTTIIIPILTIEPEITQEELRDMLYRDVLGEKQAWQSSGADRAGNIRLAAEAIDGMIMQPGEIFSFNDVVGQRSAARGYREATTIVSGEYVQALGGGICQVSSSVYASVLHTDLEVVSRTAHGLMVGYVPGGQDATVAYGSLDFKFKNSSDYPIKLEATTEGSITIKVRILGTRVNDVYYQVESTKTDSITMTVIRREVKEEDNVALGPGEEATLNQGNDGSIWEVWKYHYSDPELNNKILDNDGNHVRTLVGRTTYPMRSRVIVYNPEAAPVYTGSGDNSGDGDSGDGDSGSNTNDDTSGSNDGND